VSEIPEKTNESPPRVTLNELCALEWSKRTPGWGETGVAASSRAAVFCPECSCSQSVPGTDIADCVIETSITKVARHVYVKVTVPKNSYRYALTPVHVGVKLEIDTSDSNTVDRYLDRIVCWPGEGHFTLIMWVTPTKANPCRQGWYYYDGMMNWKQAVETCQPHTNTKFLGSTSLGSMGSLLINQVCAVIYSRYTDEQTRPCLDHDVVLKTDHMRVLRPRGEKTWGGDFTNSPTKLKANKAKRNKTKPKNSKKRNNAEVQLEVVPLADQPKKRTKSNPWAKFLPTPRV
jgi:hypothetical protein